MRLAAAVAAGLLALHANAIAQQPAPSAPGASSTFRQLSAQALAARDAQQLDRAVPLFRKALALKPGWAEGWWSLGTISYDASRYAEAAAAFRRVTALAPKQGTARTMLGLCEFELGRDTAALADIEAGKKLDVAQDPQLRGVVLFHEGELLRRAGRYHSAQLPLASLCLEGVRSQDLVVTFGMAALRMRDTPPAAGSDAFQIIQLVGRGACLTAQKDYDQARANFESAIAKAPTNPDVYDAYGESRLDAHDLAGAIAAFQHELALAPLSVLPRLRIAAADYKVDSAAGLPYAEQAVHIAPTLPFAHYLLGLLLVDTGAYARAIPHLEIARKAFPTDARIDLSLGSAYAQVGRLKDAARARERFVRLTRDAQKSQGSPPDSNSNDAAPIEVTDGAVNGPGK
ncbi:MAG TPA: tetratricopeptide repeat protein [Terracidiphilus sp.]|nr:tetratricopeptide repeat protein [Terracidiphilus sp.]